MEGFGVEGSGCVMATRSDIWKLWKGRFGFGVGLVSVFVSGFVCFLGYYFYTYPSLFNLPVPSRSYFRRL